MKGDFYYEKQKTSCRICNDNRICRFAYYIYYYDSQKRRELGGFFLGLGLITGVIGAYMQFEGKHSELLTETCGCGDPDCEDCCDNDPEQQEDCDIDEGELFSRDGE